MNSRYMQQWLYLKGGVLGVRIRPIFIKYTICQDKHFVHSIKLTKKKISLLTKITKHILNPL